MRENGLIGWPVNQKMEMDEGAHAIGQSQLFRRVRAGRGPRWRAAPRTLNVEEVLGKDLGALVDGLAGAVEDAAKHVLRHGDLERVARKLDASLAGIDAVGALEHLHDGAAAGDFENLTLALRTVRQRQRDDLGELGELHKVAT